MADFQTVMAQAARMCSSHKLCTSCPVGKIRTVNCRKSIFEHPDEFEEIVMKWAEEHPLVTNGAKFEEIFGVPFWAISCGVTPAISKWLTTGQLQQKLFDTTGIDLQLDGIDFRKETA